VINVLADSSRGHEFSAWPLHFNCPVRCDGLNNNCDSLHIVVLPGLTV